MKNQNWIFFDFNTLQFWHLFWVAWQCSNQGFGLVIKRSRVQHSAVCCRVSAWMGDQLRVGKPSRYVISHLGKPSIPLGQVNRVLACLAAVMAGCVHLCRVAVNTVTPRRCEMTCSGELQHLTFNLLKSSPTTFCSCMFTLQMHFSISQCQLTVNNCCINQFLKTVSRINYLLKLSKTITHTKTNSINSRNH